MNNLLYLNDIREDNRNKNGINSSTINLMKLNETNLKNKMNKIIKDLFILENKRSLIDTINYICNDGLSHNAEIDYLYEQDNIKYKNKVFLFEEIFYDIRILAKDNKRRFIYEIQSKTKNNENIAIRILKYDFKFNSGQSISINQEKNNEIEEMMYTKSTELYEIVLNSNIEVPDIYNLNIEINNKKLEYKVNVLKSWKYDFKDLYEKNIILLLPLKVLDLRDRLIAIKNEIEKLPENNIRILPRKTQLKNYIKDETYRFFYKMNLFIDKANYQGMLYEKDILKFNLTAIELLTYLNECEDLFLDMNETILSYLKNKYIN